MAVKLSVSLADLQASAVKASPESEPDKGALFVRKIKTEEGEGNQPKVLRLDIAGYHADKTPEELGKEIADSPDRWPFTINDPVKGLQTDKRDGRFVAALFGLYVAPPVEQKENSTLSANPKKKSKKNRRKSRVSLPDADPSPSAESPAENNRISELLPSANGTH